MTDLWKKRVGVYNKIDSNVPWMKINAGIKNNVAPHPKKNVNPDTEITPEQQQKLVDFQTLINQGNSGGALVDYGRSTESLKQLISRRKK